MGRYRGRNHRDGIGLLLKTLRLTEVFPGKATYQKYRPMRHRETGLADRSSRKSPPVWAQIIIISGRVIFLQAFKEDEVKTPAPGQGDSSKKTINTK